MRITKTSADILNKEENNETAEAGTFHSRALVPTVDIYTARVFLILPKKLLKKQ